MTPRYTSGSLQFDFSSNKLAILETNSTNGDIGSINWEVCSSIVKMGIYEKQYLHVGIRCVPKNETLSMWSCNTHLQLELTKEGGSKKTKYIDHKFESDSNVFIYKNVAELCELVNQEGVDDDPVDPLVCIKATIFIKSTVGIRAARPSDFSTPLNVDSEIALVVGDRKLYVDRYVLMGFSKVFHTMFNTDCIETRENMVVIKLVEFEHLQAFIQVLYHQKNVLTDRNIDGVLVLIDRYDTSVLIPVCEKFLISTPTIAVIEKLRIAETFQLAKVQAAVLDSLSHSEIISLICTSDAENPAIQALTAKANSFEWMIRQ